MPINTSNDFLLGTDGRKIAAVLPVNITTREQAFRTAAWISLMGHTLPSEGDEQVTFEDVLKAVMNI